MSWEELILANRNTKTKIKIEFTGEHLFAFVHDDMLLIENRNQELSTVSEMM